MQVKLCCYSNGCERDGFLFHGIIKMYLVDKKSSISKKEKTDKPIMEMKKKENRVNYCVLLLWERKARAPQ